MWKMPHMLYRRWLRNVVFCSLLADGAYREGDIRLVGGSHNREGRVEIYWMGTWGTISDSSWSSTDARVVCSQLGHSINGMEKWYEF